MVLFALLPLLSSVAAAGPRVAILSNHDPTAWTGACKASSAATVACNLRLYTAAIEVAAELQADLVHFPEAYALQLITADRFEPFVAHQGAEPNCTLAEPATSTQQRTIACAARKHNVSVAANIFVTLANGTRRIMEIVFDRHGVALATYSKSHLVPIFETRYASAGPFAPTSFVLDGVRWGIAICYEAVYPILTGDWAQFDALNATGAQAVLWAVGGHVPEGPDTRCALSALSALSSARPCTLSPTWALQRAPGGAP